MVLRKVFYLPMKWKNILIKASLPLDLKFLTKVNCVKIERGNFLIVMIGEIFKESITTLPFKNKVTVEVVML